MCRDCKAVYDLGYREKNRDILKIKNKEKTLKNAQANRDRVKQWRIENPEKLAMQRIKRRSSNNEYMKKRYASKKAQGDWAYILKDRLKKRLSSCIKNKKISSSLLLGCDEVQFLSHIESLFRDGMSWDNYGRKGWHIDHILPLSKFDLSNEDELRKACHYTNLRPLWWIDNLRKGDRLDTG